MRMLRDRGGAELLLARMAQSTQDGAEWPGVRRGAADMASSTEDIIVSADRVCATAGSTVMKRKHVARICLFLVIY